MVAAVAGPLVRAAVVRGDRGLDAWLAAVRRQLARRVDELTDDLAGDDTPGEGYLAKAGRLTAARYQAGEVISHEYGPLASEDGDDGDDELAAAGQRPAVVDRDHPQWAEVDAEQQERTGRIGSGEGL